MHMRAISQVLMNLTRKMCQDISFFEWFQYLRRAIEFVVGIVIVINATTAFITSTLRSIVIIIIIIFLIFRFVICFQSLLIDYRHH